MMLQAKFGRAAIIGHRGAMGHAPENTLASFRRALELGVDFVELDVHMSRDGVPVVIHDPTLNRTTSGSGAAAEHTVADLQKLDAGAWFGKEFAGERVPTLAQVLEIIQGKCSVVIEIKAGPYYYAGIEEEVLAVLDRYKMLGQALVISFDHPTIARAKALEPSIKTGALFVCRPADAAAMARQARADVLMPLWSHVTAGLVEDAHRAGVAIAPWTVDNPDQMRQLLAMGVDAIGTNYPDRLRKVLEAKG